MRRHEICRWNTQTNQVTWFGTTIVCGCFIPSFLSLSLSRFNSLFIVYSTKLLWRVAKGHFSIHTWIIKSHLYRFEWNPTKNHRHSFEKPNTVPKLPLLLHNPKHQWAWMQPTFTATAISVYMKLWQPVHEHIYKGNKNRQAEPFSMNCFDTFTILRTIQRMFSTSPHAASQNPFPPLYSHSRTFIFYCDMDL